MKQAGAQLIFTCIDRQRVGDPRQGDGEAARERGADAAERLRRSVHQGQNAQYLEGDFVAPQFVAFEYKPQLPEIQLFDEVDATRTSSTVTELSTEGWIAGERVRDRAQARRARTSPSRS